MRGRGAVMVVAVVLAVAAGASVFLYLRAVREGTASAGGTQIVIVAKRDIPANTQLDTLIAGGEFTTQVIPKDALIQGAITEVGQLQGQTTAFPILAGEQLSPSRFKGLAEAAGGSLGIPEGLQAVSFRFDPAQGVGGVVSPGDHVTVYGSFKQPGGEGGTVPGITLTLVTNALVLNLSHEVGTTGAPVTSTVSPVIVTLALNATQTQHVIFAQDEGTLWLALLPPNEEGRFVKPTTFGQLAK